jgi:hypothetical protein
VNEEEDQAAARVVPLLWFKLKFELPTVLAFMAGCGEKGGKRERSCQSADSARSLLA